MAYYEPHKSEPYPKWERGAAPEQGPMLEHQPAPAPSAPAPSAPSPSAPAPTKASEDQPWKEVAVMCSKPRGPLPFPEACNCQTINIAKSECSQPGACTYNAQRSLQALFDCHECEKMGPDYGWIDSGWRDHQNDAIYESGKCLDIVSTSLTPAPSSTAQPKQEAHPASSGPGQVPRDGKQAQGQMTPRSNLAFEASNPTGTIPSPARTPVPQCSIH